MALKVSEFQSWPHIFSVSGLARGYFPLKVEKFALVKENQAIFIFQLGVTSSDWGLTP